MNDQNANLTNALKKQGHTIGRAVVRTDGVMLVRVDNVFMYRSDAVDLARGEVTIEDILTRNQGKIFPDSPYRSVARHPEA